MKVVYLTWTFYNHPSYYRLKNVYYLIAFIFIAFRYTLSYSKKPKLKAMWKFNSTRALLLSLLPVLSLFIKSKRRPPASSQVGGRGGHLPAHRWEDVEAMPASSQVRGRRGHLPAHRWEDAQAMPASSQVGERGGHLPAHRWEDAEATFQHTGGRTRRPPASSHVGGRGGHLPAHRWEDA